SSNIRDVNDPLGICEPAKAGLRARTYRSALPELAIGRGNIVQVCAMEALAVIEHQMTEPRLADTHRVGEDGLEHRCQLAGRACDHPQHFRRRRLLLPRLRKLAVAQLELFFQLRS